MYVELRTGMLTIFRGLLPLVLLVVPRHHPRPDLLQIHVLVIQQHLGENTSITEVLEAEIEYILHNCKIQGVSRIHLLQVIYPYITLPPRKTAEGSTT